jgi:uncharacterized ion transporter superfamily protein YfcC
MKRFPHTYVIVFAIILVVAILTWFIPGGEFQRKTVLINGHERTIVDAKTFRYVDSNPQTWQIFSALYQGFVNQAYIIIFVLIIGGTFWIINSTKAIALGIKVFVRKISNTSRLKIIRWLGYENIILSLVFMIFSLFGAIFGMSEETIAFVVIFVPFAISMGYDSIVGLSITYLAAHIGFATAMMNPFTIGIAQGIAQLPIFSGIGYRFICWLIVNILSLIFVLAYAKKIRKNPLLSPMYSLDESWRTNIVVDTNYTLMKSNFRVWLVFIILSLVGGIISFLYPLSHINIGGKIVSFNFFAFITVYFVLTSFYLIRKSKEFFILNLLVSTILVLIVGVLAYEWYIKELSALFFALGIITAITYGYTANEIAKNFIEGAKDILSAALVIGLAGGIIVILNDGQVIDTILYYVSNMLSGINKVSSIAMMYLFQTGLNILIPSGSAKAALTMPMMSQFSDLIGLSRQLTVLAFQFGDGFTNMITPTSGVLLGALSMAKIPFAIWFKWIWKFVVLLIILGFLLLIPPLFFNFNGF